MLVYIIPLLLFFAYFFVSKNNKKYFLYIILLFLLFILSLRGDTSADYITYSQRFNVNGEFDLLESYDSFSILTTFFDVFSLGTFRFLLFFFAFINIYGLFLVLNKNHDVAIFILMFYYSYLFFVQPFNAIRAGASAIFFLNSALHFSNNDNYKAYKFYLISFFLHPTSLIGLFTLNSFFKKKINIYLIPILSIIFFFIGRIFIPNILDYINGTSWGFIALKSNAYTEAINNNIGNRTAVFFIVIIIIKLFLNILLRLFFKRTKITDSSFFYILNVHLFAILVYLFFYSLPVVAARFYEIIGIVEIIIFTYPLMIFKEKNVTKLLLLIIIVLQFLVTTLMLGGEIVKPYKFYF